MCVVFGYLVALKRQKTKSMLGPGPSQGVVHAMIFRVLGLEILGCSKWLGQSESIFPVQRGPVPAKVRILQITSKGNQKPAAPSHLRFRPLKKQKKHIFPIVK